ncbi:hypothetical protein AYO20_11014 [Fonsecaea nubica]|uniref:Rhodopsin domain-containing protein n=1 Tax=Fonsecaea nubica TaxID=856822 RepID=A0A178C2A0_9EURO|nr:hypothetical protein AYO20_11014 [Fonsecaea nubica]OAL23202.1 hypothetical protein AYO20_11014 [Fonsecaea nubica]
MAEPKSLQLTCHVVINILFAIGEGSILLRLWTRAVVLKQLGWDDWAMLVCLFFNAGQQVVLYMFLNHGGGKTMQAVLADNPENLTTLLKVLFAEEIYYIWMHFWIKFCFLLFYLRLAQERRFRMLVYGTIGLTAAVTIAIWLIYSLQCHPLQAFWYPTLFPDAKCLPPKVTYFVPGSLELVLDCIILFLPVTVFWGLQMTWRRRLAVYSVITMGGLVVVVSGLRLIVVNQFATNPDFTYILGRMILISAVEIQVGIFAANMPGIKAFWTVWRKGELTSNGTKKSQGSAGAVSSGQAHQLATLWNSRAGGADKNKNKKGEQEHNKEIDCDGDGDGSERHLTRSRSSTELSMGVGKGQISVATEYTVTDDEDFRHLRRQSYYHNAIPDNMR